MKGIILAGGSGTRLHPLTLSACKQLLPVYDKPMIYYPLTTLMLAGIRDILIITTPDDQAAFRRLLGSGEQWGIRLSYLPQPRPEGLAQAYVIGADFVGDEPSMLILGDNIFFGRGLLDILDRAVLPGRGAKIFGYRVREAEQYAVVEFDGQGRVLSIEEKPDRPKSNFAVPGLYSYDGRAASFAATIKPSARGELEITALNNLYLEDGSLSVEVIGRGIAWLDAGTIDSLMEAGEFMRILEMRQGLKVGCPEEIAYRKRLIDRDQLVRLAKALERSGYGAYLMQVAEEESES